MKKILSAIAMSLCLVTGSAVAADSCATILCLGGSMLGGKGGAMCDDPIQDYFDIKKYRHGKFSESKTFRARQDYLEKCKDGSYTDKARIQAKYGMVPNNPKKF